ncbi:MAG: CRISPR-associated protein Cas4 [Nitrososphaerales archaeon]
MSEDEAQLIPIFLIKQYHFCPRIVYFSEVLGVRERITELMREGEELHKDEEERDKRRKTLLGKRLGPIGISQLCLKSMRLNLQGKVDVIQIGEEVVIVERKASKALRRVPKNHLYQIAAYSLLVEDVLGKNVKKALIHYLKSDKVVIVEITDDIKKHVLWTLNQIKKIIEYEYLPPYKERVACKTCGYRWVCKQT